MGSQSNKGAGGGSKKVGKQSPNPLFEQWLAEWREDAVQKNSKMQYVYAKALASIRKYPLPLKSGRECLILEFIGPSMAKMIDNRMALENISFGDSQDDPLSQVNDSLSDQYVKKKVAKKKKKAAGDKAGGSGEDEDDAGDQPVVKKAKTGSRAYIPAFRSGAYGILVALGIQETNPDYRGYMTKTELLQAAQPHCESSMFRGDHAGTNYTAWSSMGPLVTKALVVKQGNPVKYMLSPEGRALANKLIQAETGNQPQPRTSQSGDEEEVDSVPIPNVNTFRSCLQPGKFEVVLYVDTSETTAKGKKEEVIGELRKNGVSFDVHRLSVGDFVWVAREIVQSNTNRNRMTISRSAELVLPYVVERKRADDLAGSIKDGRFHEQKYRLNQTGIQPIYLIEAYGKGDFGLADGALSQAVANTQITNDFYIQETTSIKETCAYLTHMTRHLSQMYLGKTVSSCTRQEWTTFKDLGSKSECYLMLFSDLNDFGIKTKNWTVKEMFARHLMRLRGLSVERAYAIVQKYPTFQSLYNAYRDCESEKEREMLVGSIYFGNSGRTVGPTISRAIYKLYTSSKLG